MAPGAIPAASSSALTEDDSDDDRGEEQEAHRDEEAALLARGDRRARRPALRYPPLRIVRYTGAALTEGAESHQVEGREVRVYNVAKTIADCFKYRNKIGLDVALEALREAWRARRFKMDELERYAAICRVQRVMRSYLEALVA